MKKLILFISVLAALCMAATVGWDNRNFIADTFQFTGGPVRTNFGPIVLNVNTTPVTVNDVDGDLMTYTVPANTLSATGDFLEIDVGGTAEAGSTFADQAVLFGSDQLFLVSAGDLTSSDVKWSAVIYIIRTGSSAESAQSTSSYVDTGSPQFLSVSGPNGASFTRDLTTSNVLKIKTVQGGGGVSTTQNYMVVKLWKSSL